MKNLQLIDVFSTPLDKRLTRLSVYSEGFWTFGSPRATESFRISDLTFLRSKKKFGILRNDQNDPARPAIIGNPGDYIVSDQQGNLRKITKKEFEILYPKKTFSQDNNLVNSRSLSNPDFLTKVVDKYKK